MTSILGFIGANSVELGIAVVFILVLLYFIYAVKDKKVQLSRLALSLVAQAEKEFGAKTGEIKYAVVVAQLYRYIPTILRPLLTEAVLGDIVEKAVTKLKEVLENGANLDSYFVENYLEGVDPGSPVK